MEANTVQGSMLTADGEDILLERSGLSGVDGAVHILQPLGKVLCGARPTVRNE